MKVLFAKIGFSVALERPASREQLVGDHPQCVNVRCWGRALSLPLLWCSVGIRHCTFPCVCACFKSDKACDAKV